MKKCIIAAKSQNNVIGKDNQLLWHIPEDMKHFKEVTMGHPVIMGRKTYESIGKPLPGRPNIVITSGFINDKGIINAGTMHEAYEYAESLDKEKCFIIGGGSVYRQAIFDADEIYLTVVYKDFEGDTFFPEIDFDEWETKEKTDILRSGDLEYRFITLEHPEKINGAD